MSVAGREGRSQLYYANNEQDYGECIAEEESSALRLVEQKQHSDRNHDRGAHQAANRAATAVASCLWAHPAAPFHLLG